MTTRSRHAGAPITDDDATIAALLEDLSVPTLLLSMVHMTGDASLLDGPDLPAGNYLNEVQGFMDPDAQARVRARALDVIRAYRDGGCVLPPAPSPDLVRRMMSVLVGQDIPEEYVPLLLEELELDDADARDVPLDQAHRAALEARHVVVIGAGMAGLLAGIRLGQAGIPYTIIEKNPGVGGTWYENRYPGCRVDVGNHFYCYSFAPDDGWTEFFAQQPELQAYFERCMHDYGVTEHVRFGTEVTSATWDDDRARWSVALRGVDGGAEETLDADLVVSAVGQLNRPKLPDLPGRDTFAGASLHSARWDPDVDLAGKRVAVVGTGASAFQIVPTIAPDVEHLTVFQRSAPWMFPNPHYHEAVGPGVPWAVRHLPYYGRWYRFLLFWPACDGGLPAMRIDPDYPHQDRAVSEINDAAREFFTQWMLDQVGDDPELAAKVVPDYVCLGKRTLQDNGSWLGALTRPDVDLVTEPIAEVRPEGIVDAAGTTHEVDLIIYATGFHANRFLWPMDIVGRGGELLADRWGDDPEAYLGMTVPGFPNLVCLYGPGTNLAHGGSIIFHAECQVRYLMGLIGTMVRDDLAAVECRAEVHDAYNDRLQAEHARMIWSHPSIRHSWYRNGSGKVTVLSPWRLVDYWSWTRSPDPADFHRRARTG